MMFRSRRPLRALCRVLPVWAAGLSVGLAAPAPHPWPDTPPFQPVEAARLGSVPAADQPAWRAYLERSRAAAARIPARPAFATPSLQRLNGPGIPGKHSRGLQLGAPAEWYAGEAAQAIADRIVAHQTGAGGWDKGHDYTTDPAPKTGEPDVWSGGTFDNDATTWELRFLALVVQAAPDAPRAARWRGSFLRGLQYTLDAQYPNGGFPQIYPLAGGYHDAITFNDDAMVQAVEFLRDVGGAGPEFGFVPASLRTEAASRVPRAVACILATQLRDAAGRPTVWCQQHDALTLQPCAARNFEPVAACTNESASLARFLMTLPDPSPEVVAAVKGAITWFARTALRDVAWSRQQGGGQLIARPGSPLLWARMYEIGGDRPIFGDRDRTVHYDVAELSSERRAGYTWFGNWPVGAIEGFKSWPGKTR